MQTSSCIFMKTRQDLWRQTSKKIPVRQRQKLLLKWFIKRNFELRFYLYTPLRPHFFIQYAYYKRTLKRVCKWATHTRISPSLLLAAAILLLPLFGLFQIVLKLVVESLRIALGVRF